jgi:single-strand DNA-binding protein
MTTYLTIIGNLTGDPELKFSQNGVAVANFSVAVGDRILNKETNEWSDGPTSFYRCTAFKQLAEHIAESLERGMRVVVYGKWEDRPYTNQQGEKKSAWQLTVDEIGPSLRSATAKVTKLSREASAANVRNSTQEDPWAASIGGDTPPF